MLHHNSQTFSDEKQVAIVSGMKGIGVSDSRGQQEVGISAFSISETEKPIQPPFGSSSVED